MAVIREKAWHAVLFASLFLFIVLVLSVGDMSSLNYEFPILRFYEKAEKNNPEETFPTGTRQANGEERPDLHSGKAGSFGLPLQVVLMGIDSGDWKVIDPLIGEGKLARFKLIKEKGAWGELQSIRPMLSPPLWTTIITGKDRKKHGIGDIQETDKKTKKKFFQAFSFDRKCPALWNILSSKGLSSCIVNWWTTWPAEQIDGSIVSNHFVLSYVSRGKNEQRLTYPDSLFDEIKGMTVNPEDPAEKKKMTALFGGITGAEKHYRNDETVARITLYLFEKYRPIFCATYFWELDHLKHIRWLKDMDEPDELIKYYYGYMDHVLSRFMALMDLHTALVVVSDHGFSRARHREKGIIAFYGAGVKEGTVIQNATVRDVTPTILALLGLPVGRDMDGRILTDAFTPELLKYRPIRFIDTYDEGFKSAEPVDDLSMTEDLDDKLRSMGYIE